MELADQLQDGGGAARDILDIEFQQNDAGIGAPVLEVSDLFQLFIGGAELALGAFRVQEEHMGIHGLVVAHAGEVDAQCGEALAGLQKSADMVG